MVQTKTNSATKSYAKIGIIAAIVVVVAILGVWAVSALNGHDGVSVDKAIENVSPEAVTGADLRMAVVRMDAIQSGAKVLQDLRKQRESFESRLRDELTAEQKKLE